MAKITDAPTTVNEGENIEIEISLNLPLHAASKHRGRTIKFAVTDADGALSGTLPTERLTSDTGRTETSHPHRGRQQHAERRRPRRDLRAGAERQFAPTPWTRTPPR